MVTHSPTRIARTVGQVLTRVRNPAAALLFVSGPLASRLERLAEPLVEAAAGVPTLAVPSAGILTEQGEVERESAAAVVAWAGGRAHPIVTEDRDAAGACRLLAYDLDQQTGDAFRCSAAVFVRAQRFEPRHIEPLQRIRIAPRLFGAGTVGGRLLGVDASGHLLLGTAAGLLVEGIAPPIIRSSPACRLLSEPKPITRHHGSTVLEIDGAPALEALSEAGAGLRDEPLILVAIVPGPSGSTTTPVIRALHGVDPVRGGLVLSDRVTEGSSIAFAAREARTARANTEGMLRDIAHASHGAAPRFAVYVNCAGRGTALYGAPDVDTRMIRARFNDMPLAGLQSAFEIAPTDGVPSVHLYSGTLALFTMPS